ncbi:phospholipid/glycerol acyltransferase [Emticicia oligotrophica DSM 17448]|uniref:Phospholipid/glycerol acyltransferase n=1 Tax=Emticicia oligotrophica (strain DSM 17448 / CIP 109782 / MTCC 6937 / GPTSA100-15) TaxID=929562 RepID=A0ABN4ASY5_EMTOG|nr:MULTISPECIES: 1-acyl-sn-glycerol-3-phosphate acyltransferase [Emticicia]AFK04956.1 phospholipid/glycerol acyltransferase [Emticicia oligotrophica DSM 17448]
MLNWLFKIIFKASGWKLVNTPKNLNKGLFAVAPHARTADFLIGLGTRAAMGINISYLGKAELFRPPFGWIFRGLGGTPVYRSKSTNFVQQVAATFNAHEKLLVAIAPEGTRKNVSKLKTGFYYMAHAANVPIIMSGFDYPRKSIIFAEPFMPTGNFEADMKQYFIPFFKSIHGFQKDWIKNYEMGKF